MRPADARAETRRLLALAWPVMLTALNWTIMQATDVAVVGLVGLEEAAAFGASRSLTFIGLVVAFGWLSGVLVDVSRADGAGDLAGTGRVFQQGLLLALLLGVVVCGALVLSAAALLDLLGVAPDLAGPAQRVVVVTAFAYPFQLIGASASYFLEGVSRPRRVMAVNLTVLPVNALLAWAWSGGHLGLPASGAVGAAAATVVASALTAFLMLAAAWTLPRARDRAVRGRQPLGTLLAGSWRLFGFGAVPALASGLELAGFSILIALSTQLGPVATHAFQLVFATHNLTFAVAYGLGSAAGVRVGNAVGEGRREEARGRTLLAAALTALAMVLIALLLAAGAAPVVRLFPAAPSVHALAAAMLPVWAAFILFDGVQIVFLFALRSLGDQVVAGINSVAAYFVTTGATGWWLVHAGIGPIALVWASVAGMVAAALLHGGRFVWISSRDRPQS